MASLTKNPGDGAAITLTNNRLRSCWLVAPHRDDNFKPLRIMIMGVPNVGKSTLMNMLVKRRVAAVGDEPAVTKSQQRINLGPRLSLVDTPGLMWPKIEHDAGGYMLAASHAIGRNAVIDEEVASFLAGILLQRYPALLTARYGFEVEGLDATGVLKAVAKRRGCLLKGRGGELDLEKAAMLLLTDYRTGPLGRVSLETPLTRQKILQSVGALRQETQAL